MGKGFCVYSPSLNRRLTRKRLGQLQCVPVLLQNPSLFFIPISWQRTANHLRICYTIRNVSCVLIEVQPALQRSVEQCTQYHWRSTHLRPHLRKACEICRSGEILFVPSTTCQVREKKTLWHWALLGEEG